MGKNGMNFGHEDIGIKGKCSTGFMMKAYAFQAGTAKIKYSWGADPAKCKAAKAKARKKMNEGKYKAALKVLSGGKGCKGANKWTKASRGRLSAAKKKHAKFKAVMKECHKRRAISAKHAKHVTHKEKSFKKHSK